MAELNNTNVNTNVDKLIGMASHNGSLMVLTETGLLYRVNVELNEWQRLEPPEVESGEEELDSAKWPLPAPFPDPFKSE